MAENIETDLANGKPEPTASSPVAVRKSAPRKPKVKVKKPKQRSDSHSGRPVQSITYIIQGLKGGKFRGAHLQWAIEKVEAWEREKAAKKLRRGASSPGFPVNASPEAQAFWLSRFGPGASEKNPSLPNGHTPIVSPSDSDSEDLEPEPAPVKVKSTSSVPAPKTPAQLEVERTREKKARLNASAFLNQAEWNRYIAKQRDIFMLNSVRYKLPNGEIRDALMRGVSTDPYCVQLAGDPVRIKVRPSATAILVETPDYVKWAELVKKAECPSSPSDYDRCAALNFQSPNMSAKKSGAYDGTGQGRY